MRPRKFTDLHVGMLLIAETYPANVSAPLADARFCNLPAFGSFSKTPTYNIPKVTTESKGVVGGINYFVAPKFRQKYAGTPGQLRRVRGACVVRCRTCIVVRGVAQLCLLRCSPGACIGACLRIAVVEILKSEEAIETTLFERTKLRSRNPPCGHPSRL